MIDPLFAEVFSAQLSKADQRRLAIIQSATRFFAHHGLTTAIYAQIADELKIQRSNVIYYFATREDLLYAVTKYVIAQAQRGTVEGIRDALTREGRLKALVSAAIQRAWEYPDEGRVMLLFHFHASLDPRFQELHREFRASAQARISAILGKRKSKSTLGIEETAQAVHSLIWGRIFELFVLGEAVERKRHLEVTIRSCLELARPYLDKARD